LKASRGTTASPGPRSSSTWTQSAVSRQIQQLESLLDIALFERVQQRVVITDAGKLYLNDVSKIVAGLRDAR
jgi:LysR family transcriptional regulator, glycine cleavage system transcriptional activator